MASAQTCSYSSLYKSNNQIYPYTLPPYACRTMATGGTQYASCQSTRGSINLAIFLRFIRSWTQYCNSAAKIHFFIETAKNFWIFLSKRRKRKSMGTTWCLFPFLEFLLQFPIFVVSGRNQRYRHKKRQVPNCLGICLNHLWEMII